MREFNMFLLLAFLLISINADAQYIKNIEITRDKYQKCLDTGEDMLECSKWYYVQMDSFLNIVYKDIIRDNSGKKSYIKTDQLKWLSTRDKNFKLIDRSVDKSLGPYDNQMIRIDKKAVYLEDRIKRLLSLYRVN